MVFVFPQMRIICIIIYPTKGIHLLPSSDCVTVAIFTVYGHIKCFIWGGLWHVIHLAGGRTCI